MSRNFIKSQKYFKKSGQFKPSQKQPKIYMENLPCLLYGSKANEYTVVEHEPIHNNNQQYLSDNYTQIKLTINANRIFDTVVDVINLMFNNVSEETIRAMYSTSEDPNDIIVDDDITQTVVLDMYNIYSFIQYCLTYDEVSNLMRYNLNLDNGQYKGFSNIYINSQFEEDVKALDQKGKNCLKYNMIIKSSLPKTYIILKSWITPNEISKIITTEHDKNFGIKRKYITDNDIKAKDITIQNVRNLIRYFDNLNSDINNRNINVEDAFTKIFSSNYPISDNHIRTLDSYTDDNEITEELFNINRKHCIKYLLAILKTTAIGCLGQLNGTSGMAAWYNFEHGFRCVNNTSTHTDNIKAISLFINWENVNFFTLFNKVFDFDKDNNIIRDLNGNKLLEIEYKENITDDRQLINKIKFNIIFDNNHYTFLYKIYTQQSVDGKSKLNVYGNMYKTNKFNGFITPYNISYYNTEHILKDLETTDITNITNIDIKELFKFFKLFAKIKPGTSELEVLGNDSNKVTEYVTAMHERLELIYKKSLQFIKYCHEYNIIDPILALCRYTYDYDSKYYDNSVFEINDIMLDTIKQIIPHEFSLIQREYFSKITLDLYKKCDIDLLTNCYKYKLKTNVPFTGTKPKLELISKLNINDEFYNIIKLNLPNDYQEFINILSKTITEYSDQILVYRTVFNLCVTCADNYCLESVITAVSNAIACTDFNITMSSWITKNLRITNKPYLNIIVKTLNNNTINNNIKSGLQSTFNNIFSEFLEDNMNSIDNIIKLFNVHDYSMREIIEYVQQCVDRYIDFNKDSTKVINLYFNIIKAKLCKDAIKYDTNINVLQNSIAEKFSMVRHMIYEYNGIYLKINKTEAMQKYKEFVKDIINRLCKIINIDITSDNYDNYNDYIKFVTNTSSMFSKIINSIN